MDNGTIALILVLSVIAAPVILWGLGWLINLFNPFRSGH